jgi:hypothetical protein
MTKQIHPQARVDACGITLLHTSLPLYIDHAVSDNTPADAVAADSQSTLTKWFVSKNAPE